MTDMPYALCAEGLLEVIHRISTSLDIPIYITETGVADRGDKVRPIMIQTYMSAVEEAVRMGYDLRGVMYWTLVRHRSDLARFPVSGETCGLL